MYLNYFEDLAKLFAYWCHSIGFTGRERPYLGSCVSRTAGQPCEAAAD
jgi:hypothetical protein